MKKWIFFVIAIPLVACYIYDYFSYKEPKTDSVKYREIGSYARYDVSYLDDNHDNFLSYSVSSLDLNRTKHGILKWSDDSSDAYICSIKENDCVWNKLALEKGNHLKLLKTAITHYVMEYENAEMISLDGDCLKLEFFDKKEHVFYTMKINDFPDSAEKAKGIIELLGSVIYD